jgi:hypothetical protein
MQKRLQLKNCSLSRTSAMSVLVSMLGHVRFRGHRVMLFGLQMMPMSEVSVMSGLFVVASLVVLRGLFVMLGCVLVMLGGLVMVMMGVLSHWAILFLID